jgi:hypothetical protein
LRERGTGAGGANRLSAAFSAQLQRRPSRYRDGDAHF